MSNGIACIRGVPTGDHRYAEAFAAVYNSAITLFPSEQRCDADEAVFIGQLQSDHNYLYTDGDSACGFASYHNYGEYCELTSLYVKRECQRMGVGRQLLEYIEGQIEEGTYIIVKALNNAVWSFDFYEKYGYRLLDDGTRELIKRWNLTEKSWEKILYKEKR